MLFGRPRDDAGVTLSLTETPGIDVSYGKKVIILLDNISIFVCRNCSRAVAGSNSAGIRYVLGSYRTRETEDDGHEGKINRRTHNHDTENGHTHVQYYYDTDAKCNQFPREPCIQTNEMRLELWIEMHREVIIAKDSPHF